MLPNSQIKPMCGTGRIKAAMGRCCRPHGRQHMVQRDRPSGGHPGAVLIAQQAIGTATDHLTAGGPTPELPPVHNQRSRQQRHRVLQMLS